MIKIKTECKNCMHHDICKYHERYEHCRNDVELNYTDNGERDDFLCIELSCVHFESRLDFR